MVVLDNGCWVWAVRGVLSHDLSGGPLSVVSVVPVSKDRDGGEQGSEDGRGTHFDMFVWGVEVVWVLLSWLIKRAGELFRINE